jgi:sulfite exporter TauE/SafE
VLSVLSVDGLGRPEALLDLALLASLGFLGSFGHCVGMCGPLAIAFSLSYGTQNPDPTQTQTLDQAQTQSRGAAWRSQGRFHGLLNLGRILSYAIVGAAVGGIGSLVVASGQLAGIESNLRQGLSLLTGAMLVWFGLAQVRPDWVPMLPLWHPLGGTAGHDRLGKTIQKLAARRTWWMPLAVGALWGLMPCGFLYAAQIKAVESGGAIAGALSMLAFGLGTVPMMWGVGVSAGFLSRDRRSQLYRLAGWITLLVGTLTLLRTDEMTDYTGYGALLALLVALAARPLARWWGWPLRYRRGIGVGAYGLALAHGARMMDHTFQWQVDVIGFMVPLHQVGVWAGFWAALLMTPLALTSCDRAIAFLGRSRWRRLHLLSIPALILAAIHTCCLGSHFLGALHITHAHGLRTCAIAALVLGVLGLRLAIATPKPTV